MCIADEIKILMAQDSFYQDSIMHSQTEECIC